MKAKVKKAFTLVEVLVASAIFTIVFVAVVATYNYANKAEARQNDYLHFESICLDIDKLFDDSNITNWRVAYFGEDVVADHPTISENDSTLNEQIDIYYFNATYEIVKKDSDEKVFKLVVDSFSKFPKTIISVYRISDGACIIDEIDYGVWGKKVNE